MKLKFPLKAKFKPGHGDCGDAFTILFTSADSGKVIANNPTIGGQVAWPIGYISDCWSLDFDKKRQSYNSKYWEILPNKKRNRSETSFKKAKWE